MTLQRRHTVSRRIIVGHAAVRFLKYVQHEPTRNTHQTILSKRSHQEILEKIIQDSDNDSDLHSCLYRPLPYLTTVENQG